MSGDEEFKAKYLCVCVPCYNESLDDLMKTVKSLMENVDFLKHKTRFTDDEAGSILREEFEKLQIVIVPIFDGMGAMHPSIKEWLMTDMPGSLDDLLSGDSESNKVEVRVASAKWWYYCWDTLKREDSVDTDTSNQDNSTLETLDTLLIRNSFTQRSSINGKRRSRGNTADALDSMESQLKQRLVPNNSNSINVDTSNSKGSVGNNKWGSIAESPSYLHFQLIPIIKRKNHRKHNSHHWFFQGICVGLDASLVFLTDCGTSYDETCLARLTYSLRCKTDLIGVTARQRVEQPNHNFHCCELTKINCLKGKHEDVQSPACWKCWISYLLSPAPLQGFEFEATLIMNSALFNLVEAMPVLPGPCQLLDWKKMRSNRVVEEYFDLLFNEDVDDVTSVPLNGASRRALPKGHRDSGRIKTTITSASLLQTLNPASNENPPYSPSLPQQASSQFPRAVSHSTSDLESNSSMFPPSDTTVQTEYDEIRLACPTAATSTGIVAKEGATLSFVEFLRVNMRLAEDRVLSFVTVFSTGYGTKWIPGTVRTVCGIFVAQNMLYCALCIAYLSQPLRCCFIYFLKKIKCVCMHFYLYRSDILL